MSINKVILIGNLGKDPEVRYFQNGDGVANFTLATSKSWKDKESGEKKAQTEWHNIVVFLGLVDVCKKYLHKGDKVYVEGYLKTEKYEKDGVTHYATKIVVDNLQMLGNKPSTEGAYDNASPMPPVEDKAFDDDIPF